MCIFLYVHVCEPACEHTFRCVWHPTTLIFLCRRRFASGTIILVGGWGWWKNQNEYHNLFPKWPPHGALDNHIICRFNWKYKSQFTHHYRQLWYTPRRLMHRGTSQMWRATRVTFKYHGILGNLIGVHLNSCPCILLSKITSSTVSFYCRLNWLYFFSLPVAIFSIWQSTAQLVLLLLLFLALDFTHTSGLLSSDILVLYGVHDYPVVGEPAWRSTWKRSCRLPVHLHTVLQQSVMLYQ